MGLVVKLVMLAIVGVAGAIAARRMANAAKAPISDEECVSCGSRDVQVQGAGVYLCLTCGYEGGSGRAAMREQTQAERYASLSPQARLEAVTEHVRCATRILSSFGGRVAAGGSTISTAAYEAFAEDPGVDPTRSTVADDICAAATELKLAATIAGDEVVLAGGVPVDARGLANALLESQEKVFASAEMITAAAEAETYLRAALARVPERAPVAPSAP